MLQLADAWVWDSWPLVVGREHHLFFLHAPRSLADPQLRHRNARIGHAVSTDLRDWTRWPDPVAPGPRGAFDEVACWTGSTVRGPDGRWWLFYTGLTDLDPGAGESGGDVGPSRQRIGAAVSADLVTWTKVDAPTVDADPRWYELAGETAWRDESWRDPWVLPDPAGDGWHMLITARTGVGLAGDHQLDERGVIGHARSPDLRTWTVGPPLSAPGRASASWRCRRSSPTPGDRTWSSPAWPPSWRRPGGGRGSPAGTGSSPTSSPPGPTTSRRRCR